MKIMSDTRREDVLSGKISATGEIKDYDAPAPVMETHPDGQHKSYWVLSDSERAKGFIRPLRYSYVHVGPPGPKNELRDLTPEEYERYASYGYVKFEERKDPVSSVVGRFWTREQLDKIGRGCGTKTTMAQKIAETYAAKPVGFYGSTFCVGCGSHLPVGETGEFVWEDGSRVGT
jgi:hypothetical protein